MPFGSLFEQLLTGPGSWSRALEFDPETGRWVDVTDRQPPPQEQPAAEEPRRQRRSRARAGPPTPADEPADESSRRRDGRRGQRRRSRSSRRTSSSTFDDVGGHGRAQAGGPRHRRPDAPAPRRRRALRDRVERDPAPRAARRRQDVLRPGDRRRVRPELHPRLDRGPRRPCQGGSAQNIDKAFETALAEPALPAVLRRVRLRRAAARLGPRPGVAADGQPAADVARGAPRRAPAARHGGDRTTSSTSIRR